MSGWVNHNIIRQILGLSRSYYSQESQDSQDSKIFSNITKDVSITKTSNLHLPDTRLPIAVRDGVIITEISDFDERLLVDLNYSLFLGHPLIRWSFESLCYYIVIMQVFVWNVRCSGILVLCFVHYLWSYWFYFDSQLFSDSGIPYYPCAEESWVFKSTIKWVLCVSIEINVTRT